MIKKEKNMNVRIRNLFLLLFTAFLILNCSSTPVYQAFPVTASPMEELSKLETDLQSARNAQAAVLAPENFKKAQASYEDAVKSISKSRSAKDSLDDIAKSRAYLERSMNFTSLSRSNLHEVISARNQALKANAPTVSKDDFDKADAELIKVTSDIEKNNLRSSVRKSASLQEEYLKIELDSIKSTNLDQARSTIKLAEQEGASEYAPRTLAQAQKDVADFDRFLTANRHNEQAIQRYYVATQASADHLLKITRESKSGMSVSSEDMALRFEREDDRLTAKQGQLDKTQGHMDNLTSENKRFEMQRKLDQKFETARKEFGANEADVYKQGDTLAIRLKGLDFPVAGSDLGSENFELLAKVQRIIESFDDSSVIIEGHTDSVGSREANQELSYNRAQSVRQYLVSNNNGRQLDVEAVGYNFQKPLASNRTAAGRAQNRRVDVLIKSKN
jgi:OmpA-OmpF porin, OOP family